MTPEEHAHVQELEALVKRYRARIVKLKEALNATAETLVSVERAFRKAEALSQRRGDRIEEQEAEIETIRAFSVSGRNPDKGGAELRLVISSVMLLLQDAREADEGSGHEQRENWRRGHISKIADWFGVKEGRWKVTRETGVSFSKGVEK